MTNVICALLRDESQYNAMRMAALTAAREEYDWNVIGDGLVAHLQTVFP